LADFAILLHYGTINQIQAIPHQHGEKNYQKCSPVAIKLIKTSHKNLSKISLTYCKATYIQLANLRLVSDGNPHLAEALPNEGFFL